MGLATESATPTIVNKVTATLVPSPTIDDLGLNPAFLAISSSMLIILGFGLLLAF